MEFKQDKRVERTRQAILNAFTEMIIETEFSKKKLLKTEC